jgi:AraC-like DNA-binding protein
VLFQNNHLPNSVVAYAQDYEHGKFEPYHAHNCAQLIHTLSGVIRVETRLGSWVIPPNRGMWIPAGVEHSLSMTGLVKVRTLFIDPLARADLPHDCSVIDVSMLLKALIIEALELPDDIVSGGRDERIVELILDELRRLSNVSFYVPSPSSDALVSLCEHISQRIAHDWTNADGAHILGISERSVTRKFQQEMSLTFAEWLRRKRLLLALEYLASGKSVLDTAILIGYDSPSAFSAMFKSRVGVSPTDYLLQSQ